MELKLPWHLSDLRDVKKNGLKVFSCFACAGGSTMGYKLAGYTVLGCNEIDKRMSDVYKKNHNPKYCFTEPIQNFKSRKDLPDDLYDLDILDGSPPCSSFSISGKREKFWSKEKKFAEGQAKQVLDDLFFHFLDLAQELKPKVVIAENVKGLLIGKAKGYVKLILQKFEQIGYDVQFFLLNAAYMQMPQERQRVFFIGIKKGVNKKIKLKFEYDKISFIKATKGINTIGRENKGRKDLEFWQKSKPGERLAKYHPKKFRFGSYKINPFKPMDTIAASSGDCYYHYKSFNHISDSALTRCQSFPDDFDFCGQKAQYICGMSVPPFMMAHIAKQVELQLLQDYTGKEARQI